MSIRRGKLELIRDALVALEYQGGPMKKTRFMYAINVSYKPVKIIITMMEERQLIRMVTPEEYAVRMGLKKVSRRTKEYIEITEKGRYGLRMLDEVIDYFEDQTPLEPGVIPPLWLLRKILQFKGLDLPKELEERARKGLPAPTAEQLLEAPGTLGLMARDVEELEVDVRPIGAAIEEVIEPDEVVSAAPQHVCPFEDCGRDFQSERSLKTHIGHMHGYRKREAYELLGWQVPDYLLTEEERRTR